MEYGLGPFQRGNETTEFGCVLILVLMEYGLGQKWNDSQTYKTCLNPCFNGRLSLSDLQRDGNWVKGVSILVLMEYGLGPASISTTPSATTCLNPCSNGIWSQRNSWNGTHWLVCLFVLILVLMEYGLGRCWQRLYCWRLLVLILVLMEYSLGLVSTRLVALVIARLNPCSNGIWSRTFCLLNRYPGYPVLILVLMEFVLGQPRGKRLDLVGGGLILVTVE